MKHSIGAYSDSCGHLFARESVAKYISKRDNHLLPPGIYIYITKKIYIYIYLFIKDVGDIILTDGAS